MKNLIINNSLNLIQKNCNYDQEKLDVVKYGLEAIYILITKTFIILLCSFLLGIFKEVIIFTIIYSLVRMFSFGLHATKSWICLVTSLITFVTIPLLCNYIQINIYFKLIICFINILLMFKNAPADTHKRPIINKRRRTIYKLSATLVATILSIISLINNNLFISNACVFSLIIQNIMISKYTYKLFKLPYDNYKKYLDMV